MGIYEHYEIGIWFESKEPLSYIKSMLPRDAEVTPDAKQPHLQYFVKCFEVSCMVRFNPEELPGGLSDFEKHALRQLWKHLQQTQGFEPRRFTCLTRESSTYSDRVFTTRETDFVMV